MWYFLGMRLTNPNSAGLPGLAEIRKGKKKQLLRGRRPVEKNGKIMNECVFFSENT